MNYILFDDKKRTAFLPLSFTRPVADLLSGVYTNRARWELHLDSSTSSLTEAYLDEKFEMSIENDNLLINGRLLPETDILREISDLKTGEKLVSDTDVLAMRVDGNGLKEAVQNAGDDRTGFIHNNAFSAKQTVSQVKLFEKIWDFFKMNGEIMNDDLNLIEMDSFYNISGEANTFLGDNVFIHKNASVNASILNSKSGPIIIDEGAEVMEGCMIHGPFYLGKHSVLKMGAKIYGPTSIGEYSKVGGEVNNSVINSYSNKAHDGFLGNSVIGQWCNLGADSNNSNLKNDYSIVKLWDYEKSSFVRSGLQFLGLIMGDHSKCGINTMFNTGTVVGVSSNIYGAGFQPNFIPSFSWGKPGSFTTYQFGKAIQVGKIVMERRNLILDQKEENVLKAVFERTEEFRAAFNKAP